MLAKALLEKSNEGRESRASKLFLRIGGNRDDLHLIAVLKLSRGFERGKDANEGVRRVLTCAGEDPLVFDAVLLAKTMQPCLLTVRHEHSIEVGGCLVSNTLMFWLTPSAMIQS